VKILLDENLPHELRHQLPGHDVFTAAFMGWSGVQNGELLTLAAANGFDVLVSNDRGLLHEQNPRELPLAVVVIFARSNTIEATRSLMPELMNVLARLRPRELVRLGHDDPV